MQTNEASIHDAPTLVPPAAEAAIEQQLIASLKVARVLTVPRMPSVVPPAPAHDPVAIGALVFHEGAVCSSCDSTGYEDTGESHRGRPLLVGCRDCNPSGRDLDGDFTCRGQMCDGTGGDACIAVGGRERLSDGAFQLPSGRLCCRECAAVAVGYRGLDDAIDLGILTALQLAEGGAL